MSSLEHLKVKVATAVKKLYEIGYVLEHEGNVSARAEEPDRYVITPTYIPRYTIAPDDIIVINGEGNIVTGNRTPSIETAMHLKIYSIRPDVKAIIHFHSPNATALATLHVSIPPFLEELVHFLGKEVPTVAYAPAGSKELALKVAEALSKRNAALLANHGAVVCGSDLDDALYKAKLLEKASMIYILAKKLGEPKKLPESIIKAVESLKKFQT